MKHVIQIRRDGTIVTLSNMEVPLEGQVETHRASHVEPFRFFPRLAFRFIRWAFGDVGAAAQWTRGWSVLWRVRFPGRGGWAYGPASRQRCIAWEVETLSSRLLDDESES